MTWKNYIFTGLLNRFYPDYVMVDRKRIIQINTVIGNFQFSDPMKQYFDMFNQIDEYRVDDITADDVILDIGACLGGFTIKMSPIVRHIIAVEPVFIEELRANLTLNNCKNVTSLPYALGGENEDEELGSISFCGRSSLVRYKSMKSILKACPVPPTVLKIDCEGGEWSISPEDFRFFRVIEAEIHNYNGKNPMDFIVLLEKEGFKVLCEKTPEGQLMLHARKLQGGSM
jgi:FkbM family methyltransferase